MNIYFIKKFYPIFKADNIICIGIPGSKTYIEKEYTETIHNLLENVINNGINIKNINNISLYKELYNKGMIIKTEEFLQSQKRNRLFFQYLDIPYIDNKKLNSKILIFGAGAGGATISYLLAQFGFTNFTIVDNDVVNDSDIEKTLIFRKEHLNKSKVSSLKKILKINFGVNADIIEKRILDKESITKIISDSKPVLVIKACDPELKFRIYLSEVCFNHKIPFIHMSYAFDKVNIGPFYIPGKTCCDKSINDISMATYGKHFDFMKHKKLFTDYTIHPSISFNINILASLILKEIIFFFANKLEYVQSLGRIIYFYPLLMKAYRSNVLKCNNKNCECQKLLK